MTDKPVLDKVRPIHPFPARMAHSIAIDELRGKKSKMKVLDPMMGSGTSIVLGRLYGHEVHGVDIDPLAVIQAKTWAMTGIAEELNELASTVLNDAKAIFEKNRLKRLYPEHADVETKEFIRFWFDSASRKQLTCLVQAIKKVDRMHRNFLFTALSKMIISKNRGVSLAMDLSHSRPHKKFDRAPVLPFDEFVSAAEKITKDAPFMQREGQSSKPVSKVVVNLGDARKLRKKTATFDLVLTSPPYLNAIDYMRCSKFALIWMGYNLTELRQTRRESIGTERGIPPEESTVYSDILKSLSVRKRLPTRHARILDRYIIDMYGVMKECSRVLIDGGRAVLVVGDSRVKGTYVANSKIVELLGNTQELSVLDRTKREIPGNKRYLPPPAKTAASALSERMGHEVVLTFERKKRS